MRKFSHLFVSLLFTGLVIAYAPVSLADHQPDQPTYGGIVGGKATNAFSNLALGAVEIPKNIINTTNKSNVIYGALGGLFKGLVHTAGRIGAGVVDLVTLPIPTQPITRPENVWDNFDVDTTYGPVFRLVESHETPAALVPSPAPIATPTVTAPPPAPIDNSKMYKQETNRKLDTLFKKEMSK